MQPLLLLELKLPLQLMFLLAVVVVKHLPSGSEINVLLPQDVYQVHVLEKREVDQVRELGVGAMLSMQCECEEDESPCCEAWLLHPPHPVPQYLLNDNNTGTNVKREKPHE